MNLIKLLPRAYLGRVWKAFESFKLKRFLEVKMIEIDTFVHPIIVDHSFKPFYKLCLG